jgi:CheY-like chemotaxis protein
VATRRVLVVDDEAEVRSALADLLCAMRYADALEIEGWPTAKPRSIRWCASGPT